MAPNFDDVSKHSVYSGGTTGPLFNKPLGKLTEPEVVTLNDGSKGVIYPIYSIDQVPESLVSYLHKELNDEIERGDTYPFYNLLSKDEFEGYWFSAFTVIMLRDSTNGSKEKHTVEELKSLGDLNWEKEYLGTYYVKPNYTGRCSHVCNAGFLVNPNIRGNKIGTVLGKNYLRWAPVLGYTYSVFNLVFVTNVASVKIWDNLGFDRIGLIPKVAVLKGHDEPVDAIMFGKVLSLDQ